jgi:WD40 repeat protein
MNNMRSAAPVEPAPAAPSRGRCPVCGQPFNPRSTGELCPACLLEKTLNAPDLRDEDAATHPSSATQFADFELLEEIGRGGNGIVYRARQRALGRIVALKLLQPGRMLSRAEVDRFQREAETIASLEHPHIVPVFDAGEHEGQPWIALRLMPGGSLADRLRRPESAGIPAGETSCKTLSNPINTQVHSGTSHAEQTHPPLRPEGGEGRGEVAPPAIVAPPARSAQLLRKLALAVHHAHQRGILHGDLKPANVLLDENNEPHLADFGLARVLEPGAVATRTLTFFGSPAYAAPEQVARDRREITTSADIYGLGAILYELLTGRPPFEAPDLAQTFRKVLEEDPIRPSHLSLTTYHSSLPLDLETICLKCLEKDPLKRYPTAQSLADDLQRFLNNEPITARPITRTAKLIRWSQRNPTLATAYSLLILLLILILIGSPLAALRLNNERNRAENASEREFLLRRQSNAERYTSDMNLAHRAWEEGAAAQGRALLRAHIPHPGEPDLRGFEWRYLRNLWVDESRFAFTNFASEARFIITATGTLLASDQQKIVALDPTSRTEREILTDPDSDMSVLALSSAATNLLATAGYSGTIKLWDLQTSKLLRSFRPTDRETGSLDFSPDGKHLAWAGEFVPVLGLLDLETGTSLWTNQTLISPRAIRFNRDGKTLISGGGEAGNPIQWDIHGHPTPFPLEHQGWVTKLALSADGRKLATAAADNSTIIWDIPSRRKEQQIPSFGVPAFSPDGQVLALGARDSTIQLWDLRRETQRALLRGQENPTLSLQFAPDGESLYSSSGRTLRVWSPQTRQPSAILAPRNGYLAAVAISPDAQKVAAVDFHARLARIWRLSSRTVIAELPGSDGYAETCAFSPDGRLFALGSDETIKLYDTTSFDRTQTLSNPGSTTTRLSFTPDGSIVVSSAPHLGSGLDRKWLKFWDLRSYLPLEKPGILSLNAAAAEFSPDGKLLAVGYFDGKLRVWNFEHEACELEVQPHQPGCIWSVAFSPDGHWLASGSDDRTVTLLDLQTRHFVKLAEHNDFIWMVRFAPDGRSLVSSSNDSTIKFWNPLTHRTALTLKGGMGPVNGLAFTRDGTLMASCNSDGTVHLWSAPFGPQ